jgi:hypothetical protein
MKQFRVPRQDKPVLEFELVYDKQIDGAWQEQTEKFTARGSVPGNLLVSLTASMAADPGVQAHELQRMFATVIIPEDKPRFMGVLDDPDTAVPIETLGEIMSWLAEEYSSRPTSSA